MNKVNRALPDRGNSQSFMKRLGSGMIWVWKEIRDIWVRSSDALDFAVMWVVSDKVFESLGFPERNTEKEEEFHIYKKDAYFAEIEQGSGVQKKQDYCDLLVKTQDFRGRKYVFEEVLCEKIPEYEVFSWMIYSTRHDAILRNVFQESPLYISSFLDTVSHSCYSNYEAELFFDILYQKSWGPYESEMCDMLDDANIIIRKSRKWKTPLSRAETQHISKTISLLKIKGKDISFESIDSHNGLYTFIPTILSSTHGESSTSIGVVKWFVKTHRPKTVKTWWKHFKLLEALVTDGTHFDWVRKRYVKAKMKMNALLKRSRVDRVTTWAKNKQVAFWEKKMDAFLWYTRYFNPESLWELDKQTHKELMKNYFLIDKILQDIESWLQSQEWNVEKKPSSRIYRFLLWRGKSESIGPFAAQAWLLVSRMLPLAKVLSVIPFIKIHALLLVAKTTFVFAFYKLVDVWLYLLRMIPSFERYQRFGDIQSAHSVSASPELQDLLIENLWELHKINRDVWRIRKVKKLKVAQRKLERDVDDIENIDDIQVNKLENTMLEEEINDILEEVDKKQLQDEIVEFKMKYLALLEETWEDSNKSFLE